MSVAESLIRNFYRCVEVSCLDTHTETIIHSHTHTLARVKWPINAAGVECTFLLFLFSIHFVLGVRVCTPVVNGFGYQSKTHTNTQTHAHTVSQPVSINKLQVLLCCIRCLFLVQFTFLCHSPVFHTPIGMPLEYAMNSPCVYCRSVLCSKNS